MVVMAVVLVILAIIFDTGLMLPAFLFAVLYYIFLLILTGSTNIAWKTAC